MRTHLMAGTALVAATMLAGGALAADKKMMKPSMSVGGYWHQHVGGILDEDADLPDTSAVDTRTDSEIYFKGSATLDSGIKITTFTQLEGGTDSNGDWIDEYGITVSGSFGQITMGGTENAPTRMVTGFVGSWATGVGETLAFDSDDYIPSVAGNFGTLQHSRLSTGDGDKIIYITPKFEGFQLGVSYQATTGPGGEDNEQTSIPNADTTGHDGMAGAITYSGRFGDVGIGAGAGIHQMQGANNDGEDEGGWIVAGRLDFGSARIAAGYKRTTDPVASAGYIADVGVRYTVGANAFSLTGSHGEMDDAPDRSYRAVMGSYARTLGAGVKVAGNLIYNESKNGAMEASGLAGVTSLLVSF